ncbi:MAG: hypothetical protein HRF50_14075 [Phycisphaerae bacterium]|jgi:hypothetical protein
MTRDVQSSMADENVIAVCVGGGDWPRGILSTAPIPDRWLGLIESPDGRRRLAPSGEAPRLSADDRLTLVRNRPIAIAVRDADLVSRCGHGIEAAAEILVRWNAREDDLAALRRTLLHADTLTLEALTRAVADGGALAALRAFVRERNAESLIGPDVREAFLNELRQSEAARRFAFEAGLTFERVARLDLNSASFARERSARQEAQWRVQRIQAREMVEQAAAAATKRRLDDLAGVMEKLRAASSGDPNLRWHDLLPTLSPAERGRLLENLWRLTPDRHTTTAIVAVAGPQVVWLDPSEPGRLVRRAGVPEDFGGLRCVDACPQRDWLLVGAASGVWALDTESGAVVARFAVPGSPTPRTGFNTVLAVDDRLYATHSTLGFWSWPLSSPEDARPLFEPHDGVPRSIRCTTDLGDGRIGFAADDCLHAYDPRTGELAALGTADGTIHSVAVLETSAYVGTESGRVMQLNLRQPEDWWQVHRARGSVESIVARRWNDLRELVIPAGPDGALALYPDESITAHVLEAPVPIRRVWATDDMLVALNENRDRLIVMGSLAPDRRGREAPLARLTGHTVQDVCLLTRAAPPADRPAEPISGAA